MARIDLNILKMMGILAYNITHDIDISEFEGKIFSYEEIF